MTEVKKLSPITMEEFEVMEKDEHFNYELIDGIVLMSPSPSYEHQKISSKIARFTGNLLNDAKCDVLVEYDVKFNEDIYRPDVMIFCNNNKDIPAIVFEILSPSTRQRDLLVKPLKYQAMGVKEYWIIDPKTKTVIVHDFVFETAEIYAAHETIHSCNLPEIVIAAADIFA